MNLEEKNIKIWAGEVPGYKLLDSGRKEKLEEINGTKIIRAEPRAWWNKSLPETEWKSFQGETLESILDIGAGGVKAKVKFKNGTKHIGIFPEQAAQWRWIEKCIKGHVLSIREGEEKKDLKVLNLFGYTGIASLVAAKSGAKVTHVDASKQSVDWAKENQKLSGLENAPIYGDPSRTIRWIVDDAVKFIKKEARRMKDLPAEERGYDAIIMDPPSYGKGPKGEVWKIEEKLPDLLKTCKEVLSDNPLFVIFNMYSTELSSVSLANLLSDATKNLGGKIECGELAIPEQNSDRLLPMSIFAIWEK